VLTAGDVDASEVVVVLVLLIGEAECFVDEQLLQGSSRLITY
jgi:hypothetical protein